MKSIERVTVSLPADLVQGIDACERNRSRFIAEAVRQELGRRRREGLLASLRSPHPEGPEWTELGEAAWAEALPDALDLLDPQGGQAVRWVDGQGWMEGPPA